MYLNKFAVCILRALLIDRRCRRAGVHHRVCRAVIDNAGAASSQHDRVGFKLLDDHAPQILGNNPLADTVIVFDDAQELPELMLFDFAFGLGPARLFVQSIQ